MKRKTDDEIKAELRAIYADKEGEMPDLTKLERRGGSRITRILVRSIVVLFVLSAAAWGGFLVWSQSGILQGRPLNTSVETPETVRSGEETFYTFRYENAGTAPIAALGMKLTVPPEFSITSLNPPPTDPEANGWTIGSLSRASDGAITVGGVFRSEVPSEQTIQALYTYKPANFSSDFQDIATAKVKVDASVLQISVNGPEKALPGDEATYVVNVQNSGLRDQENVLVEAMAPEGFAMTSADPATSEPGSHAWKIAKLTPGELKAITVKGTYTSSVSGEQTFGARAAFLNSDNVEFTQTSAQATTDVLGGAIAFHLVVNGSPSDQTVDPGKPLRVSVDYANNGNETVQGLSFSLALTGTGTLPVDWPTADLGGGTRSGNTVTWDKTAVTAFDQFTPSTSGTIDLMVPTLSTLSASLSSTVVLTLTASLDQIGSVASPRSIGASPVTVGVNSDFRSSAHAEYYDENDVPVGTGPLPPQVGKTTTYRLVWRVANSFHPLSGMRMTTNLPPKVAWTANAHADVGTITFDETTRIVTWHIDAVPTALPGAEATFDVAVTPDAADVGSFYKLTNAIAVEATDTVTKDQVQNGIDILTTELPEDTLAEGKGIVVK